MKKVRISEWEELEPLCPAYALVANVDLVVIRWQHEERASVLYGRCLHRGALMSDGSIEGKDLICGVHQWDYGYKTGVSSYNPEEKLHRFQSWIEDGALWVDANLCGALGLSVRHVAELDGAISKALAHNGPSLVEIHSDVELI